MNPLQFALQLVLERDYSTMAGCVIAASFAGYLFLQMLEELNACYQGKKSATSRRRRNRNLHRN